MPDFRQLAASRVDSGGARANSLTDRWKNASSFVLHDNIQTYNNGLPTVEVRQLRQALRIPVSYGAQWRGIER